MCRLMVYLGSPCLLADLVTRPARSLTRQSYAAKERLGGHGYLNGDGFGIGWYVPGHEDPTPCVFRSTQPAWNNCNLESLAVKTTSPLIFAHVRAAYPGIPVSESNCQPFSCGRYLWMHNGGVAGFHLVRRKLLDTLRDDVFNRCPSFESDSAICFALFLNQIDDPMVELPQEELVAKMEMTINEIDRICTEAGVGGEESLLNFVVSDGRTVVATRYTNQPDEAGASLYYASGSKFECLDKESNAYYVRHADRRGLLGIVASEPLTEELADWIRVPRNSMVVMTRYKGEFVDLHLVPINPPLPLLVRDVSRSFKNLASCVAGSVKVTLGLPMPGTCPPPPGIPFTATPRHSMSGLSQPVLAIAVDNNRVFAGSQGGLIKVYDLTDFSCVKTLAGHSQTIFALTTHDHHLYSSSTRVVKIWDMDSYQLVSNIRHSDGDVFALALAQGHAVAGPAGTSIIRCNRMPVSVGASKPRPHPLSSTASPPSGSPTVTCSNGPPPPHSELSPTANISHWRPSPYVKTNGTVPHDATGKALNGTSIKAATNGTSAKVVPEERGVSMPAARNCRGGSPAENVICVGSPVVESTLLGGLDRLDSVENGLGRPGPWVAASGCAATEPTLSLTDTERMGHCSRVYALAMCHPQLCSGAGDGFVKVWSLETGQCVATLYGHKGGVMALAAVPDHERGSWRVLSGSRDNTIRVWDLASTSCITTITGHVDDVLGIAIGRRGEFYSASADHTLRMWSLGTWECLRVFVNEGSTFLSIACADGGVLTGSSDGIVRYWEVERVETPDGQSPMAKGVNFKGGLGQEASPREEHQLMEEMLRNFVHIPTISTNRTKSGQDQTWKGANYLMALLEDLGAEAKLVVAVDGTSPVVMGRIMQDPSRLTVTVCGHYDVTDAPNEGWDSDPFDVTAVDGYLYGRGVSDSKGPLIAVLFAIKELVGSGELKVNLVFVLDGMKESGCIGFKEAVHANLEWFEGTGLILTTNGAWLSDDKPCLIYGMRGLICLTIEITGPAKDLHSGSDSGAFNEPMNDLVTVLANLIDSSNMILIPGFYDDVKELHREEEVLYEDLDFKVEEYKATSGLRALTTTTPKDVLMSWWRNPSLSITGIESSVCGFSLIPKSCSAKVCIRHVPDQSAERLVERFRAHVAHEFAKLRSASNSVDVRVQHVADWWLADPTNHFYKAAEQAIAGQWGTRPLYVREGGTMPMIAVLEKALRAPALHVPVSQATGHSDLKNERLRWKNFVKGKDVVKDLLSLLGNEVEG